jgi:adenine modification enzyme
VVKVKGYIEEQTLFGHNDVIGFGTDDFYVKQILWELASKTIIKNHYSHKTDSRPHNKINLGVYFYNDFVGVLQYGYAMNALSMDKIVKNTKIDEYLELNRMWLDDKAPKNSESKAISYSIKYIKRKYPKIKWIQSFADERCGCFGIVYQAANFKYFGHHESLFWEIDGEILHNSRITNGKRKKKYELENRYDLTKAKKNIYKQFRYIYFIDKRCEKDCLLTEKPYEKHYLAKNKL